MRRTAVLSLLALISAVMAPALALVATAPAVSATPHHAAAVKAKAAAPTKARARTAGASAPRSAAPAVAARPAAAVPHNATTPDAGCDGTIAIGERITCSITSAGQTQSLTFPGVTAHHVRLYVVKTAGLLTPYTQINRPGGSTLCGPTSSLDFNCTLDTTGTHTIAVRDVAGTATGTFVITLQDLTAPAGCTALAFGPTGTTGTLSAAGQLDCYTVAGGASGQRWRLRLIETSGTLNAGMTLTRPDGSELCSLNFGGEETCLLDVSGTLTIAVRDSAGTSFGGYRLVVQKFPTPTGCTALTVGTPIAESMPSEGVTQCFTVSASGNPMLRFYTANLGGGWTPYTEVLRPDGTTLCGPTTSLDFECRADTAGSFTLYIRDVSGLGLGTGKLNVQNMSAPVGCKPITIGVKGTTATIGGAAALNCFQVAGSAGQRWRLRLTETSGPTTAGMDVSRPDGSDMCGQTYSQEETCLLDTTGTYTVSVRDSTGLLTGDYRLVIEQFPSPVDCTVAKFAKTKTVSLTLAGEFQCLKVNTTGTPYLRFMQVVTTPTWTPYTEILRTDGTTLCGPTTSLDFTCHVDVAGTLTILFRDVSGQGTGKSTFSVQNLTNPAGCGTAAFGETGVAGSITTTGQLQCFQRTGGKAGQRWRVRLVELSGALTAGVDITRPDGSDMCGQTFSQEETCLLDTDGTYTISVRDNTGVNHGTYQLIIEKFPNPTGCDALTLGTPTNVNVASPGQFECFTFTASPSTQARAFQAGAIGWTPYTEIIRPDGTTVCGPTTSLDFQCTLDVNGTYTVLIRDVTGSAVGTDTLTVVNTSAPTGCTALAFGETGITQSITGAAQLNCAKVSGGKAADRWRLRLVETSGTLSAGLTVDRPDGSVMCSLSFSTEVTCQIDTAGAYTILIRDSTGLGTGNYRIVVEKFPNPTGCTAITVGAAATSGSIASAGQIKCYTFSGTSGQNIHVQVANTGGTWTPYTEMLAPDGTTACGPTTSLDFMCPLATSGTFTVIIRDVTGPATGTFTVKLS